MMSSWAQRRQQDTRRLVILDDDPTGTQTVADVEVILHPSLAAYRRFFAGTAQTVYILTNSRALPRQQAVDLVRCIRIEVEQAAQEADCQVAFLLRGDSTLRGHVFAEMDALGEPYADRVGLFIPAFPEGGRVTLDGVHYLLVSGTKVPVAQTEFARDTTFGYRSEHLLDWVAEVGEGRLAVSLPLAQLRAEGAALVTRTLLTAEAGTIIVPDVETRSDLELIAWGLLDAEAQGRHVVVRSAATFASVRSGLQGRMLQSIGAVDGAVLVVCGSHTQASTRQLEKLVACTQPPVVLPTNWLLRDGPEAVVPRLARQLALDLKERKFAILTTERVLLPEHGDLEVGAQIMDALTATVARVAVDCDAVIVKGGISSARVALSGLSALRAYVQGQLEVGVSLWQLDLSDDRRLPYAVIPGNVGNEDTLVHVARLFQAQPFRTPTTRPALSLQPVEQTPILVEITQRLLDYLLSGELKPGSRLPSERQLSEALGLGRSTLRESLKSLALLGLIEVRQGDGTYLKRTDSSLLPRVIEWGLLLGERRMMDLVEARQKIEIIVAELAAQRRDSYAVEELRKLLEHMHNADHDYQTFMNADVAFHLKLADMARNTALRDILASIQGLLRAWILRVVESAGSTDFSYREHQAIFDAVERGDSAAAALAMQAHMDSARERLVRAVSYEES